MPITQQILDELKKFEARTVAVNKDAFRLNVAKPQKILAQICGRVLNQKWFSRQQNWEDDFPRRNVLARFLDITAAVYFAAPKRGERFIQFVESFFAYLRATRSKEFAQPKGDFFEIDEQHEQLLAKRRTAVARGNKQLARELSPQIFQLEQSMPHFLKRDEGESKRRRRKTGKSKKVLKKPNSSKRRQGKPNQKAPVSS